MALDIGNDLLLVDGSHSNDGESSAAAESGRAASPESVLQSKATQCGLLLLPLVSIPRGR